MVSGVSLWLLSEGRLRRFTNVIARGRVAYPSVDLAVPPSTPGCAIVLPGIYT